MSRTPIVPTLPYDLSRLFVAVDAFRTCHHPGACEHKTELEDAAKEYTLVIDEPLRKLTQAARAWSDYGKTDHEYVSIDAMLDAASDYARSLVQKKPDQEAELLAAAMKAHDEFVAAERAAHAASYSAYIAKNALADYRAAHGGKTKT